MQYWCVTDRHMTTAYTMLAYSVVLCSKELSYGVVVYLERSADD